jgi:N-acetylmuramoyl-L-alanine amidase
MQVIATCCFLAANISAYGATVIAASALPVSEYTRITIETDQAAAHSMIVLKNPDRVVLDLKNTPINQSLKALTTKILPDDFYIKQIRVANFKQGVTRIVVDLKAEAKPKLSVYKPTGDYQHRLALDIYPMQNAMTGQDENGKGSSEAFINDNSVKNTNAGDSKSSGAKIILEPESEMEPDAEMDMPADPY